MVTAWMTHIYLRRKNSLNQLQRRPSQTRRRLLFMSLEERCLLTVAPSFFELDPSSDTGVSSSDRITSATSLTVLITAAPDAQVEFSNRRNASPMGGLTTTGGIDSFVLPPLPPGRHELDARTVDSGGNRSTAATMTVTIDDSVALPASLQLKSNYDSGISNSDRITRGLLTPISLDASRIVVVSGEVVEAGTVTVWFDSNENSIPDSDEYTRTSLISNNAFESHMAIPSNGNVSICAFQTDIAGNVSEIATGLNITFDSSIEVIANLDLDDADDDGESSNDNVTSYHTGLTITGSGETNAIVTLYDDLNQNGTADLDEFVGSGIITNGTFAIDIRLNSGPHTIRARVSDLAGNVDGGQSSLFLVIEGEPQTASTPPVLSNLSGLASYHLVTNPRFPIRSPIAVEPEVVLEDVDSPTFGGGTIVIANEINPVSTDRLSILSGFGVHMDGAVLFFNGLQIGTVSGGYELDPLVISFNSLATSASAQAVLRNVAYSNDWHITSVAPRIVSIYVTDGEGGISTVANSSVTLVEYTPQRQLTEILETYYGMVPVSYTPSIDRWTNLPVTSNVLRNGGELRVVMLGDSIVDDTSRSAWDVLVQNSYSNVSIKKFTSIRGNTGCWWYEQDNRMGEYVLAMQPNLVIIGGISQRGDIGAITNAIRQIRLSSAADILLMTGPFGRNVDPRNEAVWSSISNPAPDSYEVMLEQLAEQENCEFLDVRRAWAEYVRMVDEPYEQFYRDEVHANEQGEQILARILSAYFSDPLYTAVPVLEATTNLLSYVEGDTAVPFSTDITFDANGIMNFDGIRLTAGIFEALNEDILALQNQVSGANAIEVVEGHVFHGGIAIGMMEGGIGNAPLSITFNAAVTDTVIQDVLRALSFVNLTDNPTSFGTNSTRSIYVQVSNGHGLASDILVKSIQIVAVNDAPLITGLSPSLSYSENSAAILLAPSTAVTDVDSLNFELGTLTIGIANNVQAGDVLRVRDQGPGFNLVDVVGLELYYNGMLIGNFSGGWGEALHVVFTANATPLIAQTVVRNVMYENLSDNPTLFGNLPSRNIEYLLAHDNSSFTLNQNLIIKAVHDVRLLTDTLGNLLLLDAPGQVANTVTILSDVANGRLMFSNTADTIGSLISGVTGIGTGTIAVPFSSFFGTTVIIKAYGGDDTVIPDLSLGSFSYSLFLDGGDGDDNLYGANANDKLIGGAGNDRMNGGAGDDIYLFDADTNLGDDAIEENEGGVDELNFAATTSQGVNVDLSNPEPLQLINSNLRLTLGSAISIENVRGSSMSDSIKGNSLANVFVGGPGDDNYLFDCDLFQGSDIINEFGGGIDSLDFTATSDIAISVSLQRATAQIVNSALTLTIMSSSHIENVIGGSRGDSLVGNSLANRLEGFAGNDSLTGGGGNDLLIGGLGNDIYWFRADSNLGNDTLDESGGGIDTLNFSSTINEGVVVDLSSPDAQVVNSNLTISLSPPNDFEIITGSAQRDQLRGNALANVIFGGPGDDELFGEGGRDLIVGGSGADIIHGGDDDDILIPGTLLYFNESQKSFNNLAIDGIMSEWTRTDDNSAYEQRIAKLRNGGGLNRHFKINSSTLTTDGLAEDRNRGESGLDWFWEFSGDIIDDLGEGGSEVVN
jgi:Ca2+-binding RTX toxin-like protein